MKVLVYTRPRINIFFKELVKKIPIFTQVVYFSDHHKTEQYDVMSYFYTAKKEMAQSEMQYEYLWKDSNLNDVVRRCRYLRMLDRDAALLNVKSMFLAMDRIIEIERPDYIFGMVMDSYVLDICDRLMRRRGRQYIGFLNNMINGYSRLTCRGELIKNIQPSQSLVEEKISELKSRLYVPNMQQDFMWKTSPFSMFFTKYCKEKIKIAYYWFKKIVDKDPDNFYSNTVASKYCMSCRKINQLFFRKYQNNSFENFLSDAKQRGKKVVYLPLQFYPECSIDYWGTSIDMSDFYKITELLLDNQYKDIVILVKEHPSAYGLRKANFYKEFKRNSSFCLVPFDLSSNDVIERSDLVLTWTGSVGIEAVIRNKPLVTLGDAYYAVEGAFTSLQNFEDIKSVETVIKSAISTFDPESQLDFNVIENMIGGLVEGYVFPLDYGTKKNPFSEERLKALGSSISELISKIAEIGHYPLRSGTYG